MNSPAEFVRPVVIHRQRFGFRVRSLLYSRRFGDSPRFQFVNETGLTVRIDLLRTDLVRPETGDETRTFEVGPWGTSVVLVINPDLPPGKYEYIVEMGGIGIEAEGGSRPEIEVDP